MKGLAFLQIGKVGVIDKPIPEPGPNDAVVKTTASLICTSDVHNVRGVIEFVEGRFLGHESVGVVHKVGANVTRCSPRDPCQRGFTSQCGGMLGGYQFGPVRDGNLAEYFLVNDADFNVVPI